MEFLPKFLIKGELFGTILQRCCKSCRKSTVTWSYISLEIYRNYSPVDPKAFCRTLNYSLESRLLGNKNADLAASARVLDREHWPKDINYQLKFDENEVRKLSNRFQLNERDEIWRFHEYLIEKTALEKFKHLKSFLNTIPISSRE
jgi:hypothetical protein